MASTIWLGDLTAREVREIAPGATVVLPVTSTEQHGAHLPLRTDYAIGEAVIRRAAERAAASVPVLVAPVLPYGFSGLHLFSCAMSLRASTFLAVLDDLADSLVGAGFKRLFLLNCHGGNDECVKVVARDLVTRHQVAVAACSYWDVAGPAVMEAGLVTPGHEYVGHAGATETSIIMALTPEQVRTELLPAKNPDPPRFKHRHLAPGLTLHKYGEWARIGGISDFASDATPEWGERLLDLMGAAVGDAIVAFHREAYQ